MTEQNEQALQNFDLINYRNVLMDPSLWIYKVRNPLLNFSDIKE